MYPYECVCVCILYMCVYVCVIMLLGCCFRVSPAQLCQEVVSLAGKESLGSQEYR